MKITKDDVGKSFKTRGGWMATVIWVHNDNRTDKVVIVHREPGRLESCRVARENGTAPHAGEEYNLVPELDTRQLTIGVDGFDFPVDVDLEDGKPVAIRLAEPPIFLRVTDIDTWWRSVGGTEIAIRRVAGDCVYATADMLGTIEYDRRGRCKLDNRGYDLGWQITRR